MDSLQVPTVGNVDGRIKSIVYGFIHENSSLLKMNIPDLILTLCILFYNSNDNFVSCSSKMRIPRNATNYAQLVHQGMNWSTAIGQSIIDLAKYPSKLYYEWTILSNASQIFIGIDSTPNLNKFTDPILDHNIYNVYNPNKYYAWCSLANSSSLLVTNDKTCKYSTEFKHGIRGKIKMIIDCKSKNIIFIRNNQNLGITFSNIDLSRKYHLAVCLYKKGTFVHIIDETNMHY